jgi:glycerol-3-phosphate acyltransferase PlsY
MTQVPPDCLYYWGEISMKILPTIGLLITAYLLGTIPFGYLLVKGFTGKDVRQIESGRTGATNTMRAAGYWLGFITSILDVLKSAGAVWITRLILPDGYWLHVMAGLLAVIGHNYSIFLIGRNSDGRIYLGGGAGGTPAVGSLVGLWWPNFLILLPAGLVIVLGIGYASLATMLLPIIGSLIFLTRFIANQGPWQYIFSGLLAEIFILWALRPNILRLINGTERKVGLRSWKRNDQ